MYDGQPDGGIPWEDLPPITVTVDAPVYPDAPVTTVTVPPEVVVGPGGETTTLAGSLVTLTGQWPQDTAAAMDPNDPNNPNNPNWTPSFTRPRNGWTAVNENTPYTPGPDPPKTTVFYEPAVGNQNPGVPLLEAPTKCGPNLGRCDDQKYCDPQPLCTAGLDCPGLCLPLYGGQYSQPESVRGQIWDKAMAEGLYQIHVSVKEIRIAHPNDTATLATLVKRNVASTGMV